MTTIYIIDDMPGRHRQYNCLLRALQTDYQGEFKPWSSIGSEADNNCTINTNNATTSISADNIFTSLTNAPVDSVFLVDFNLRKPPLIVTEESKALLKKLELSEYNGLVRDLLDQIPDSIRDPYFHAAFIIAFAKARGIPTIVISTHEDGGRLQGDIDELVKQWSLGHSASAHVTAWKEWKNAILNLRCHDDPTIRKMLVSYFEPIRQWSHAWNHDWCQEGNAITKAQDILGNFCIDEGLPPNSKSKEVKALFRRCEDSWKLIHPENIVSSATLKAALSVLQIKATVDCRVFEFPASPGIAFLIALKELLNVSKRKGAPESIRFFALPTDATTKDSARVFGVEIVFTARDDNPDGLGAVLRLGEKLKKAGADTKGPGGGLAEGIWNLGHCRSNRSNGIRTFGQEWAEMFAQGSPYWLAWPSFAKNSVTFHWQSQ